MSGSLVLSESFSKLLVLQFSMNQKVLFFLGGKHSGVETGWSVAKDYSRARNTDSVLGGELMNSCEFVMSSIMLPQR